MKYIYKILCNFGFHLNREKMIVEAECNDEPCELYYDACPHCGDGNPYITGEF
jgi:hypothetical protein